MPNIPTHRPFLVLDLEATCCDRRSIPRAQTEIIEIGAVLVEPVGLTIEAEFQTFVKPVLHPVLTPFCTELTSIEQAHVENAPSFRQAIRSLGRFVRGRNVLFGSWGDYDRNQLRREGERNRVGIPLPDHINLKARFAELEGRKKRGLGGAIARAGLTFDGTAHRGIDDARNIARLLPFLLGRIPLP